ncbi:hypothetical protein DYQ86_15960 [Acidobacteria bacterium AB60]|nr:hypothetical protein DYQ86_15960 [Acidobacteria bacterium AB60]
MKIRSLTLMALVLAPLSSCAAQVVVQPGSVYPSGGLSGTAAAPTYPVTAPTGATHLAHLEQSSGWVGDSTFGVSGAYAPTVCQINPGGGNPCPGAGTTAGGTYSGAGGGSTMTLTTTGVSGQYSGWMARLNLSTSGQLNMLMRATYQFDNVSPVQAFEIGRRSTNSSGVTDNGQTQLVPIGGGQLELDYVPNGAGAAWTDTTCRFPMWVINTAYTEEWYFINDSNGALSLKYVSLNGTLCQLPSNTQHQSGVVQSPPWASNSSVIAFQPDAKPGTGTFNTPVTMELYLW